jgi:hypothetical protein
MKMDKAGGGESSKKKRKFSDVQADKRHDALSPGPAERRGRDPSSERNTRREYSSELGEDSPQERRDWRGASRPLEGGYRSRDFESVRHVDERHFDYRGGHGFYDRDDHGRYGKGLLRHPRSPARYSRGGDDDYDERYLGSRGRPERFRRSLSPPSLSRENRGRRNSVYDMKHDRSPPPSTSRGLRQFHDVKDEKEAPNRVQLDTKGEPTGKYADMFRSDIVAFSKELDPGPNWEGQTQSARDRLEERIRNEWLFTGESKRLSKKWLKSEVGKALINFRHRMGKLIDAGEPKPPEMKKEFWDNLVKKRGSRDWKALSETMMNVARHRSVRNKTRVSIEKSELIRLVSCIMLAVNVVFL